VPVYAVVMRWLVVVALTACSSPAEPDELEVRIETGAIARDHLSRILVLVDPPVAFDRTPGGGELEPGVEFEFFAAGDSNRLMVTYTPPPTASAIDQELVFTAELGGGNGELGSVRVVGYDPAGQAIARAEKLDVRFGGFSEVALTLTCTDPECPPIPGLGGYPVTLDSTRVAPSASAVPKLAFSHAPAGMTPMTVFADPGFGGGQGRIAILDPTFAAGFQSFDLPANMLPCMITGDALDDRFGTSVAFGDHLPGVDGPFIAVGAPGAGDTGAVFILPMSAATCPRDPVSAQPGVVRLDSAGTTNFGTSVAFADPTPNPGAKLVIGAAATNENKIFVVGALTDPALTVANSFVITSFAAPTVPPPLVAAAAPTGSVAIAFVSPILVVATDPIPDAGEAFFTQSGNMSTFGTSVQGPGPVRTLQFLPGPSERARLAWASPNEAGKPEGIVAVAAFPDDGKTVHVVDCSVDTCLVGAEPGDEFGYSLSVAPLRSPVGDLVIGAPGAKRLDTGEAVGAVYVFAMDTLGTAGDFLAPTPVYGRDPTDPSVRLLYRLFGTTGVQRFGHQVGLLDSTLTLLGDAGETLYFVDDLDETWGPR
jgi:hypothetical protein